MSGDSWYVETLLRNREQIRSDILSTEDTFNDTIVNIDFDNFDYNNLLLVEKTLQDLIDNGQLSKKEIRIINAILAYKSLVQIESELHIHRTIVAKTFERVCDRIAFILGDYFTNEGYLDYITEKYGLDEAHVEKARTYISS